MFEELKCYLMDGLTLSQTIQLLRILAETIPEYSSDARMLVEKLLNMEELTGYSMGDAMTDEEVWDAIKELEDDLANVRKLDQACDLTQLLKHAGIEPPPSKPPSNLD